MIKQASYPRKREENLDTIDEILLLAVRDNRSLKEMSERIGKSITAVQKRLFGLPAGFIVYEPGKARSRYLTALAIEYLKRKNYIK